MSLVKPDKSRYVWLYAPSTKDKQRWAELAKKSKVPLSRFIISKFEDALASESDKKPNAKLIKEIESYKKETKTMKEDIRQKSLILAKYEAEIKHYQSREFLEDNFEGARKYSHDLIAILKQGAAIDGYKLLDELGVDPKDFDLLNAVSKQLEELEGYGLIASTSRGWRWVA